MRECPRIVIAGTHSGTGKTSLTLALSAALLRRGLRVRTFKVGPDFLDPTYHAVASGRPCHNLDGWMSGRNYVTKLFSRISQDADIALIEGVMGLFDGASPTGLEGSTAEIAAWLDAPVLLTVNAHGAARSLAATVKGFASFDERVRVSGVLANFCGSARHAENLRKSLAAEGLPPLTGGIVRGTLPELPSRHLGLVTANQVILPDDVLNALADAFEKQVNLDMILDMARGARPLDACPPSASFERIVPPTPSPSRSRIAVAMDEAFHFYYQDLFDELRERGCDPVFFSPLRDAAVPFEARALYLGGGYPEAHARALSENRAMLESVRAFAASGRTVYAECGGLMYLSRGVETLDGTRFAMAGLLPAWTRMREKRRMLGYVEARLERDSLWGVRGDVLRGHEFHYSELLEDPAREGWECVYALDRRRGGGVEKEGFQRGNVLASYAHLHLASRPAALDHFMKHWGGG